MDLIFPEKAPETRVEFLEFTIKNLQQLKVGYAQWLMERIHKIQPIQIQAKFERARQEYGDEWKLFGVNAESEGLDEVVDGVSYFAWWLLQQHFSSPPDETF